jgi:hypothetical protein
MTDRLDWQGLEDGAYAAADGELAEAGRAKGLMLPEWRG